IGHCGISSRGGCQWKLDRPPFLARPPARQGDLDDLAGVLDRDLRRPPLAAAVDPIAQLRQQRVVLVTDEAARTAGSEERTLVAALLGPNGPACADELDLPARHRKSDNREVDVERADDPVGKAEDRLAIVHER